MGALFEETDGLTVGRNRKTQDLRLSQLIVLYGSL
jgi:hypothetical protein